MQLLVLLFLTALIATVVVLLFPGRAGRVMMAVSERWPQFLLGFAAGAVGITMLGGYAPLLLMTLLLVTGSAGTLVVLWAVRGTAHGKRLVAFFLAHASGTPTVADAASAPHPQRQPPARDDRAQTQMR